MLRAIQLCKDFGGHRVLRDVSFVLNKGARVGLVGLNGSGKSTLFDLLLGRLEPDSGHIEKPDGLTIGWVPQTLPFDGALPVKDALSSMDDWEMQLLLERAQLAHLSLEQSISTMSGGERTRLLITKAFWMQPDVLLLDEPTNNLDIQGIALLERLIDESDAACLIASHDRRLLNNVTTRTFELDVLTRMLREFGGNYAWYRQRKQDEEDKQWRQYNEQQRRIRKLESDIRATKQTALATENSTVHYFYRGRAKKVAAKAKARETRLTKMLSDEQRIDKPHSIEHMRLSLEGTRLYDKLLFEARNLSLEVDDRLLLHDFNLELRGNARLAIMGANGSGKSTLLRLILGELEPDSGSVRRAASIRTAYMSQVPVQVPDCCTVLDYFTDIVPTHLKNSSAARTFLHRFLFAGDDVFKRVTQLSQGERSKLAFASFMATAPELLILDEPTNHMDVQSVECLEVALREFSGALIVVSHDREFLDQIGIVDTLTLGG